MTVFLRKKCYKSRHYLIRFALLGMWGFAQASLTMPARAQTAAENSLKRAPQSHAEISLSFAPIVRQVAPAVVNIYATRIIRERIATPFDDPFFRRFFGGDDAPLNVPRERQRAQNSLGSGVIVDTTGIIVTNAHVIDGASEIKVVLSDRREFPANLLLVDKSTDLAVMRIDAGGQAIPLIALSPSQTAVEAGDLVLAIGNPFGLGQTVTQGIVSSAARSDVGITDYSFFIQTDAAINPGNSGGALVGADGKLIGINTAIFSRGGESNGIGFAIPAAMVRNVVAAAKAGRTPQRPWFGASGQSVTAELAEGLRLDRPMGMILERILAASPAARAGLKVGDVVVAIDGQEIVDATTLKFRLATADLGGTAQLTVMRSGKKLNVALPLEPPPETPPRQISTIDGPVPLNGAMVGNLSPAFAIELGMSVDVQGVVIVNVRAGSSAARLGFRPGDIIAEINGNPLANVDALARALKARVEGWRIIVQRGDRRLTMAMTR